MVVENCLLHSLSMVEATFFQIHDCLDLRPVDVLFIPACPPVRQAHTGNNSMEMASTIYVSFVELPCQTPPQCSYLEQDLPQTEIRNAIGVRQNNTEKECCLLAAHDCHPQRHSLFAKELISPVS